ncbi:MAG: M20/M25/M40 family metallo-hydrolase [Gaiellaceae bacterium]
MPIPDLLRALLETPGPTGSESAAAAVWREAAGGFAEVTGDVVGNSIARVPGTGGGPTLAIFGHIDEIGLTITHADDLGNLSVRGLGGWNPQVLLGQRVEILTRDGRVAGVVAAKREPLRKRGDDEKKRVEMEDLHLDIGARDAADAWKVVRPGDPAVLAATPVELLNGRLSSRALDDRLGAYIALEAARRVAEAGGAAGDVVAVATVEEEAGDFLGARTAAFALEPAVAIAVDVTWASDVPGGDPKDYGEQKLGDGAAILRGPGVPPKLYETLAETAKTEGIPYCVEVSTGRSHTDADAVFSSRAGVPTGVVSIPLRHMHTPGEICDLADVEACIALIAAFARRLGPGSDFTR